MSPIDLSTIGTGHPRTTDGRSYPERLRAYESLDDVLLPLVAAHAPATFDDLSVQIGDAKVRAALPRWLASAEWRGLVERQPGASPRTYVLGIAAASQPPHAA